MAETPPERYRRIVGAVFKEARENAGLSQKKLAELTDVGRTGIVMMEAGQRDMSMLLYQMLADGIGVPLASLVQEIEKRLKKPKK